MDQRFARILIEHLPSLDGVTENTDLAAAGLDSLATVSLLVDIEERFDTYLPDELISTATFATAGSLWAALQIARHQD